MVPVGAATVPEDTPDKLRDMEFVEPEDEPGHFRNPLPPDDRLWRHPSEVGAGLPPASPSAASRSSPRVRARAAGAGADEARPSMWLVAAVSAVSAGLLATGLVMVTVGLVGVNDLRPAVERQMEPRPIDAVTTGVVDVADRARAAVAQVRLAGTSTVVGSGIIFRSDGHMLTSASVVGTAGSVRVRLDSGRELTGRVLGSDPDTDIAVIKIDGDGPFPTAILGTAQDLRVGEQVIAIGCPVELVGGPSVTVGVISALHRSVPRGEGGMLFDLIQTDARVPTGWPGGRPPRHRRQRDRDHHLGRHRHHPLGRLRLRHPHRPGPLRGRPARRHRPGHRRVAGGDRAATSTWPSPPPSTSPAAWS